VTKTQLRVLQRIAWALKKYGREYDFDYGRGRRRGLAGLRMFCGPTAQRKAARDRQGRA
jgi:hypothetical protein